MADSQYSEDTKEMCEVAVMGTLLESYKIRDVKRNIFTIKKHVNMKYTAYFLFISTPQICTMILYQKPCTHKQYQNSGTNN